MGTASSTFTEDRCDTFLSEAQKRAIRRFTIRCRNQHGGLFIHSMGSGKTRTGMAMALNLPRDKLKIIITPPALDSPWREEALDAFYLPGDIFRDEKLVKFINYEELARFSQRDLAVFSNAIVLCDEAHWLLNILSANVQVTGALKSADKVYLLTGTPLQKNWTDLCILVNIAAGKHVMPGNMEQFNNDYARDPAWRRHLVDVGNYVVGPGAAAFFAYDAHDTLSGDLSLETPFSSAYKIGKAAFGVYTAYNYKDIVRKLVNKIRKSFPVPINVNKLFEKIKPYVSYFDFHNLEGDELLNFPVQVYRAEHVPLTPFQLELLTIWAFLFQEDRTSLKEHALEHVIPRTQLMYVLGQVGAGDYSGATEKLQSTEDEFRIAMRRIGNLTWDHFYVLPERYTMQNTTPEERERMDVANCGFGYKTKPIVKDEVLPESFAFGDPVYVCPKFVEALHIIEDVRTRNTFLPLVYSNFDEFGFQSFSAFLNRLGYRHIVIHADDDAETRLALIELAKQPYKRLAPGRRGEEPITALRSDDMMEDSVALWGKRNGWLPEKIAEVLRKRRAQDNVPYCVLLHPTIKEGISLIMNPTMIVLEAPDGYGNQEQIYARVLRSLRGMPHKKTPGIDIQIARVNGMVNAEGRVDKNIVQMLTSDGLWEIQDGKLVKTSQFGLKSKVASAFATAQRWLPAVMPYSARLPIATRPAPRPDSRFARQMERYSATMPARSKYSVFPGMLSRFRERLLEYFSHERSEDMEQSFERVQALISDVSMDERTKDRSIVQERDMRTLGDKLKELSDDAAPCDAGTDTNTPCTGYTCPLSYGDCYGAVDSPAAAMGGAKTRRRKSRSKSKSKRVRKVRVKSKSRSRSRARSARKKTY